LAPSPTSIWSCCDMVGGGVKSRADSGVTKPKSFERLQETEGFQATCNFAHFL
jgi:hypothetical protein